jgi:hypothetical protein
MTLLESVVAFVLLAVVGVACLDLTRGATRLETSSVEWTRAVTLGESALAAAAAGSLPDDPAFRTVRITRRPWGPAGDGIDVVEVQVPLPEGAVFRASRLVRGARVATGTGLP